MSIPAIISAYGQSIVTNGLIFHIDGGLSQSYPGTGTVWYDVSTTGNNANLVNGPAFNSMNGGAITFDGSNDYGLTVSNSAIASNAARTLCAWIYPTTISGTTNIMRIGTEANGQLYEILFDSTNIAGHFWGNGFSFAAAHGKTMLNTWSYVVMTYDSTTVSIYTDGVLKGFQNFNLNTANTPIALGIQAYFAHVRLNGKMATASLYNRSLTSEEVRQNYYAGKKRLSN